MKKLYREKVGNYVLLKKKKQYVKEIDIYTEQDAMHTKRISLYCRAVKYSSQQLILRFTRISAIPAALVRKYQE